MRLAFARTLLSVAAATVALSFFLPVGAADISDDEFKALLDQDVKSMTKATAAVAKAGKNKNVERNAANGIKSSALLLATYSNSRIDGKDAAADGKSAAIRDLAIKIYQAAGKKDFKAIDGLKRDLAAVKPAANAKKIDVAKALGEVTQNDVMDNFKTTDKYGTNVEADIKANGRKASAKPTDANLIALRVLAMSELNKTITKAENMADRKEWDGFNEKMIMAAKNLQAAGKKKTSAADMAKLFTTLDSSCTACHDMFK